MVKFVLDRLIPADFFWAANSSSTVRDVIKMEKLSKAFSDMLDAAN